MTITTLEEKISNLQRAGISEYFKIKCSFAVGHSKIKIPRVICGNNPKVIFFSPSLFNIRHNQLEENFCF